MHTYKTDQYIVIYQLITALHFFHLDYFDALSPCDSSACRAGKSWTCTRYTDTCSRPSSSSHRRRQSRKDCPDFRLFREEDAWKLSRNYTTNECLISIQLKNNMGQFLRSVRLSFKSSGTFLQWIIKIFCWRRDNFRLLCLFVHPTVLSLLGAPILFRIKIKQETVLMW